MMNEGIMKRDGSQFDTNIKYSDNEYSNVYFRIETPSYYKASYGVGFENNTDRNNFDEEVKMLFLNNGWELLKENRSSGCCYEVVKGNQRLYLHPQNISGDVIKNEIKIIADLLQNNKTFSLRWVDVYEDIYDMTDDEYIKIFKDNIENIKIDLLEGFQTKRKNLFRTCSYQVMENITKKYNVKRLKCNFKDFESGKIGYNFVNDIFEDLIKNELIVTASTKNGTGYRTNKELLKKLKINVA